jgi:hypothetical protein
MRRALGTPMALLLACALLLPTAAPVAADPVCRGMGHFMTATVSFPAGYWGEGTHSLTFRVEEDATGVELFSFTQDFEVSAGADLYPGQVLMDPGEEENLQLVAPDHAYPDAVNPEQPTVARYVLFPDPADPEALSFLVWARTRTTMYISWDDHPEVTARLGGLNSACLYGGPNKTTMAEWLRAYGAFQK